LYLKINEDFLSFSSPLLVKIGHMHRRREFVKITTRPRLLTKDGAAEWRFIERRVPAQHTSAPAGESGLDLATSGSGLCAVFWIL
jgi:hypothetical protein